MCRRTKTNQRTGHWEPKRAFELDAQTRNTALQSSYRDIISKLKYTSRENSNSKIVPELLTQVRKKKMGRKDAGMCFQYIREIRMPFHVGQEMTGMMCRYRFVSHLQKKNQLNFWFWMKVS